ncbi:MAG: PQQ-dependent sugar dehydrogenase [Acidimicrobiia bacterium]|nr:PQQ-dependent sugar dehydrogenase [Acidimicrobiia bacterium]
MGSTTSHRRRRTPAVRTGVALLTIAVGIVAVACSAPDRSTGAAATATSSTSTSIDPGSGPTSITTSLRTTEVAQGFDRPTAMANRPMRNQLWIAERAGRIRVVALAADWNLEAGRSVRGGYHTYPETVLDISGDVSQTGERGVLGIAFSTDGTTVFLSWVNGRGEIVVASWAVTDSVAPTTTTVAPTPALPSTADSSTTTRPGPTTTTTIDRAPLPVPTVQGRSRRILLSIPREGDTNYGGHLALGRDGFLYIGVGDATQGAAVRNAQDPQSLLGKILRIDPGGATMAEAYAIPASNPWAKGNGAPPVFTIGVHDPLRFSFDRLNGDLWVGDAGEGATQEVVLLPTSSGAGRGANLGWPLVEGTNAPPAGAPADIVAPILSFDSGGGNCPVIGGYVYRGQAISALRGVYVYGDRCSGAVSGLLQRRGKVLDTKPLGPRVGTDVLTAFGQDDQGELYVLLTSGNLLRLVA